LVFWSWSPCWSIKEEELHILQILWTHILGGDPKELLCEKHKTVMWWLTHLTHPLLLLLQLAIIIWIFSLISFTRTSILQGCNTSTFVVPLEDWMKEASLKFSVRLKSAWLCHIVFMKLVVSVKWLCASPLVLLLPSWQNLILN
jgi:hypothetical protein